MAANVESMFSVREKPWHGLGTIVMEAPASADALRLAGLDWNVVQEPVYTGHNELVEGYKANIRSTDRRVLGVVSDRYKVVQNVEAFSFTDELLGAGVRYETAGSLQAELERTGVAMEAVQERYKITSPESMNEKTYKRVMEALSKTKAA